MIYGLVLICCLSCPSIVLISISNPGQEVVLMDPWIWIESRLDLVASWFLDLQSQSVAIFILSNLWSGMRLISIIQTEIAGLILLSQHRALERSQLLWCHLQGHGPAAIEADFDVNKFKDSLGRLLISQETETAKLCGIAYWKSSNLSLSFSSFLGSIMGMSLSPTYHFYAIAK